MSISTRNLNSGSDLAPTADPSRTDDGRANALSPTVRDLQHGSKWFDDKSGRHEDEEGSVEGCVYE